ncbi:hypothetical protein [Sphingosinicella sp. BN140058]|uniref:DUF5983 family protein n=1 Tax=Sphingosinicella sp. BN140058 TaxID=1892855 RepID=UPI00101038FD|nr:hypothetical protein [Sphingosinicella sp. BN140058]QAY80180.1 hypothetical protein ETR14_26415 [Sphingosinicella sp. BN140058]
MTTEERRNSMYASVSIDVRIQDPAKLYAAAVASYQTANADRASDQVQLEIDEFLGAASGANLRACLLQLYDHAGPDAGLSIEGTSVEIDKDGFAPPRTSTILHLSTAHLRAAERDAITRALGFGPDNDPVLQGARGLVLAEYNGLYLRPKDFGFFVRVPTDPVDTLPAISAEMRAALVLATKLGAWMIDFDPDETACEGLPVFEDERFMIRDFNADPEDPLYWSSAFGWVDRGSADCFYLEAVINGLEPAVTGKNAAWVRADDHSDSKVDVEALRPTA